MDRTVWSWEQSIYEDADETSNNDDERIDEDDDIADELVVIPTFKNLTDYYGTLPPMMKSRTRSHKWTTLESTCL